MKTNEEYDEITKVVANKIYTTLKPLLQEDERVRPQLLHVTMQRVQCYLSGDRVIIDGSDMVRTVNAPEGVNSPN